MSENPISISHLNDFTFCPVSIYFHGLDYETEDIIMQDTYQINGTAVHSAVDSGTYSDKRNILQGCSVFCEKYNLIGKIDTFDIDKGILTERKKRISTIYDGYVFQLYAQYFALKEMGYTINSIRLYSMEDNKIHNIPFPEEDNKMMAKFNDIIGSISSFTFSDFNQSNIQKCSHCIYEPLCSYSALKG